MSLEEKVGQLFIVPICPKLGKEHVGQVRNLLKERHIGGVMFSAGTVPEQIEIMDILQKESKSDLWAFQDAEWGVGMRLTDVPNLPKNLTLGAITDLSLLEAFGVKLARQCLCVGLSGNFAPVCDVNTNSKNPVIGSRSFGDDPSKVAGHALAVMKGMQKGGIMACAKHFPGHGDTAVDSHLDLPSIDHTELLPFQTLIDAGVDLVMVGHLLCPSVSKDPSSLSKEIMTDLLRDQMGFRGLIVTDALNMKALSDRYSLKEIVTKSLLAGADLLLTGSTQKEVLDYLINTAIPEAIDHIIATLPVDIIDEKVARILAQKKPKISLLPPEDASLRRTLFRSALTLLGSLPSIDENIALVQSHPDPDLEYFLSQYGRVTIYSFEELPSLDGKPILNIRPGDEPPFFPESCLIALFDSPYKLSHYPSRPTLIGYEDVPEAKEAVADALFGKLSCLGKLPVRVFVGVEGIDGNERPD